nr:MAG TPA: hypothetical protein [Caudoviricetes sp.]
MVDLLIPITRPFNGIKPFKKLTHSMHKVIIKYRDNIYALN